MERGPWSRARRKGVRRHCAASRHAVPRRRTNSILAGCCSRRSAASCWRRCANSAGCEGWSSGCGPRRQCLGVRADAREDPERAFISGEEWSKVRNALDALPDALFDALPRLEWLDLAHNRLRGLPASIAKLTALISLNLVGNDIGA